LCSFVVKKNPFLTTKEHEGKIKGTQREMG
jgi:hypothetical protein